MKSFEQSYQYWLSHNEHEKFAQDWYDCRKRMENMDYRAENRNLEELKRYNRQIEESAQKICRILYEMGSDYYFGNKKGIHFEYEQLLALESPELDDIIELLPEFMAVLNKNKIAKNKKDRLLICNHVASINKYAHKLCLTGQKITMKACYNRIVNLIKKLNDDKIKPELVEYFLANNKSSAEFLALRLKVMEKLSDEIDDIKLQNQLMRDFDYCEYMADNKFYNNFVEKIIPNAKNNPDSAYGTATYKWSQSVGGIGLADFVYHSFGCVANPKNINLLLCMAREIPAFNAKLLKRNINYANIVEDAFKGIEDAFCKSAPGLVFVIDKMIDFYNAKNSGDEVSEKRKNLLEVTDVFLPESSNTANMEMYDKISLNGKKYIYLLKKMRNNMPGSGRVRPQTAMGEIDKYGELFEQHQTVENLTALLEQVNNKLLEMIKHKQHGIQPELVEMLDWADRETAEFLEKKQINKKTGFYKTPLFKQVLLFSDLIYNNCNNFDVKSFEKFYAKKIFNQSDEKIAYKKAANRQIKNMFALFALYDEVRKVGWFDNKEICATACNYADIVKLQAKERKDRLMKNSVLQIISSWEEKTPQATEFDTQDVLAAVCNMGF